MASSDISSLPSIHSDTLAARAAALELLQDIFRRKKSRDQALSDNAAFSALSGRDRAFARMLITTCLRRHGQIDDIILRASERPDYPRPPLLHDLLRLSIAQILFMDVPDYAAVDTAVRLGSDCGLEKQKGFINAVLRRVTREGAAWLTAQDEVTLNFPDWLLREWTSDYGTETAYNIARTSLCEAPLDISLKDSRDAAHWAQTLEAQILSTGTLRRPAGGAVQDLPGFADGMWWVQDAAAALPVHLMGNVVGKTVIDLCAAPGGKTAQLAAAGAHVIALDRSRQRLQRLEENMRRLRLDKNVNVVVADAASWQPPQPASFILLDAPCSATGTIRRNPDILISKTKNDMDRLIELQARLLDAAAAMLAPGGILIYCTCSLQKAEGENQIELFLARRPEMRPMPISENEIGLTEGVITPQGDVRLLPSHLPTQGGMDGFFITCLKRP